MSKRTWIIFVIIIIGIMTALVISSRSESSRVDVSSINQDSVLAASSDNGNIADHVFGKADSKIILIEYGDLQCPPCGSAHPAIKQLVDKYSSDIAFIFRNYPIPSLHPNARAAAAAAEAAGLQEKYWEMNDLIYTRQSEWSSLDVAKRTAMFSSYADSIGLNTEKFMADLSNTDITKKIDLDISIGRKAGVEGTPTFELNGEKIDLASIEDAIKASLNK
jgi:protein-disulfide isomerase